MSSPSRALLALALAWFSTSADASPSPAAHEKNIDSEIAAIRTAFSGDRYAEVEQRLDALLRRENLSADDRIWALHSRIVLLHQRGRPCALVDAATHYLNELGENPKDEQTVIRQRRARRRQAEAKVECVASRERPAPPPPPPPAPPIPPTGRGMLLVGSGAVLYHPNSGGPTTGVVATEASLGYHWPGGWQLDGGLLLSFHSVVVRPGLRLEVGRPWSASSVELRLAGQLMVAPDVAGALRVAGGALVGVGLLLDLGADFDLVTVAESSLWPIGWHLAVDGRVGVSYAF